MRLRRRTTTIITSMQCRLLVTIFLVLSVGINVHFFMKHSESSVSSFLPPGGKVTTPLSLTSTSETIRKKKVVVNHHPTKQLGGRHGDELSSSREVSTLLFPDKPPRERFPNMDKCKVIFRDSTMATCHMGAYGGTFLRVLLCVCVCVCVPTFVAFLVNRSTNPIFIHFPQIKVTLVICSVRI